MLICGSYCPTKSYFSDGRSFPSLLALKSFGYNCLDTSTWLLCRKMANPFMHASAATLNTRSALDHRKEFNSANLSFPPLTSTSLLASKLQSFVQNQMFNCHLFWLVVVLAVGFWVEEHWLGCWNILCTALQPSHSLCAPHLTQLIPTVGMPGSKIHKKRDFAEL